MEKLNPNRFEITNENLGKGAFGEVYVAYEKNNKNKKYAAKQIKFNKVNQNDQNQKAMFENLNNEVSILLEYNNENLVHCYGLIPGNDELFIITEYCNGKDLNEIIKKWKEKTKKTSLPEKVIQKILKDILNGLSCLHRTPMIIIHHDIKLQNILVDFEDEKDLNNLDLIKGTYKITDFGLSKYHPDENAEIGIAGTSTYWSPEIKKLILDKYRDGKHIENEISILENPSVDIWAIGVLTYRLLNIDSYLFLSNDDYKNYHNAIIKISEIHYENMKNGIIEFDLKNSISKELICFLDAALKFNVNIRASSEELEFFRFITRPEEEFHYINLNNYKQTLSEKYYKDEKVIININEKSKLNVIDCFDE